MKTKVFSFSTKTESDAALVGKFKKQASNSGRSFSWVVIQALKAYEESKTVKAGESNVQ